MAELNMEQAKQTYDNLCKMLDERGWKYERVDGDLTIKSGIKGDDLPIEFLVRVNPRNEIVSFLSLLPFNVDESKRVDMALAVCAANYCLADGSFDYNLSSGKIIFRLTSSYKNSILSADLFEYMIMVSAATVDVYNDKFFMISKGVLSIQKFLEEEAGDN